MAIDFFVDDGESLMIPVAFFVYANVARGDVFRQI